MPAEAERSLLKLPIVKVPFTVKLLDVVTVAEPAIARLLNVSTPELTIDEPSFMVMVLAVGARVLELFTVNAPATLNELEGCVLGVSAIVKPLNTSVPELEIVQLAVLSVIVPPVGERLPLTPIVKTPFTVQLKDDEVI